jgi:hypothetical protein
MTTMRELLNLMNETSNDPLENEAQAEKAFELLKMQLILM